MKDILVVAIVFAVPISAILSAAKVKLRRMELEAGAGGARHLEERCAKIERENADLQQRLSVLESIVTMDAPVPARTRVRVEASQIAADDGADVAAAGAASSQRRA